VRIHRKHALLLMLLLVIIVLAFAGCTRSIGIARGWSGGVVSNSTLFVGSMEGEIFTLDANNGAMLGDPIKLEVTATGGGLGCIPTCGTAQSAAIAIYGSPVVKEDLVYVGGYDGKVYAYAFQNGVLRQEPRWVYPRQGSVDGPIIGGIAVAEDKLYFASAAGTVFSLDAADGFKEWEYSIGEKIWSTPTIVGDTLYIGCFDEKLYALDITDGTKKWDFQAEGAISATPLVYDGTVYFGSFDRHIYAIDETTGDLQWKFPEDDMDEGTPGNWFWTRPVEAGGIIYAACLDGKVYAIDEKNGDLLNTFDLGNSIASAPVVVDGKVIVAATSLTDMEAAVYALSSDNSQNQLLTIEEKVYAPLFASDTTVYVHTADDNLYAINVNTGASQKIKLKLSE